MPPDDPVIAKPDRTEVDRQAQALAPAFRRVARQQALKLAAVVLVVLVVALTAFSYGNWPLGVFALVVIVVAFVRLSKASRRRQMGVSLPTVLHSLGLEQSSGGLDFLHSLPARLFPRDGDIVVSSQFSGRVEGFPVAIAEVEVRDRTSDSSDMLFEGLVLRVALPASLPQFLLLEAAHSKEMDKAPTKGWFASKPPFDVGSLVPCPAKASNPHGLRLWLAPSAAPNGQPFGAVLDVLSDPPPETRVAGRLHSAANDEQTVFVALRLTDAPGRIDWTSASGPGASLAIHVTFEWLAQPMALAKALIGATVAAEKS